MSVLIIGGKGNMGRRYQAVMKYVGRNYRVLDQDWTEESLEALVSRSSGFIIATPTVTHSDWIRRLAVHQKPILCEKPLTTDMKDLKETLQVVDDEDCPLNMVYQYKYLLDKASKGLSKYDYWNHGKDGLVWDCIQILGLAHGHVELREDSPIWRCWINGSSLDLRAMDLAYVQMIEDWLKKPGQSLREIRDVHEVTDARARGIH